MTHRRFSLFVLLMLCAAPVLAQPVTQPFTFSLISQPLPQVRQGVVAWGDYDGDGDLDALVSGRLEGGALRTGIYRNDGKRPGAGAPSGDSTVAFVDAGAGLTPVVYSRAAWGDADRDNDLDLVVQGSRTANRPYQPVTTLYRNTGSGFTAVQDAGLPALHSGAVAWADYDRDGDNDLLLSGADADEARHTFLLRNDNGNFTQVEVPFPGIAFGDAQWGDYDGDGDPDLFLAGASDNGFVARIYRNDNGTFADIGANLERVAFASVDWGDYDDDGDLDALLAGGLVTPFIMEGTTQLYQNNNGTFARVDAGLAGVLGGAATFGDYDNDGDLDVLVLGSEEVLGRRTARIYRNDDDDFVMATLLVGALFADADWGDYDGDDDLDLLASGFTSGGPSITNLYENKRQVKPDAPATPAVLVAQAGTPGTVSLAWTPPTAQGLTYNLRVGTTPGGADIVAPLADPATGRRHVFRPGNAQQNASWTLEGLDNGTYYWSVQSLNHAFAPSPFAAEGQFTVSGVVGVGTEEDAPLPKRFAVHPNYPNPFATGTTIPYDLPAATEVVLKVYDVLGREVAVLINGVQPAGRHQATWDGRDRGGSPLGAGLYLYELRAGDTRHTGTMTRLR